MQLKKENTALVVIDVQGKLAQLMYNREELFANLKRMIKGAKILGLPILWTEQYPQGLGPTDPDIAQLMTDLRPLVKDTFSCCDDDNFVDALKQLNRRQLLLTGIETHVCIYQTASQLLEQDYQVEVVYDAVSSRTAQNKQLGLERMRAKGAGVVSTEMCLFELLRVARGEQFKAVLNIVK